MKYLLHLLLILPLCFTNCSKDGDLNVFSVEQDLELGQQTDQQIRDNPAEYPVMRPSDYPQAYDYLQGMVDEIVREGSVPYSDLFPYTVTLLDSEVENAFATPGGFIYVYTGLIATLDSGDELAGVLAHEIAHSARRHSTNQLTTQYGFSTLLSLITGGEDPGLFTEIAGSLLSLRFSRSDESEADASSVDYLCNTRYAANGAAGFFESIQGQSSPPPFLSSHPASADRVADINARAADKNCDTTTSDVQSFEAFQSRVLRP